MYHPPLFSNLKWVIIKAAAVHQPVIHQEVDDLLDKGAIEPSTAGNVFIVAKHMGGLHPMLNCKCFNCSMNTCMLKIFCIIKVWKLI